MVASYLTRELVDVILPTVMKRRQHMRHPSIDSLRSSRGKLGNDIVATSTYYCAYSGGEINSSVSWTTFSRPQLPLMSIRGSAIGTTMPLATAPTCHSAMLDGHLWRRNIRKHSKSSVKITIHVYITVWYMSTVFWKHRSESDQNTVLYISSATDGRWTKPGYSDATVTSL